jgi:hypothetical protein
VSFNFVDLSRQGAESLANSAGSSGLTSNPLMGGPGRYGGEAVPKAPPLAWLVTVYNNTVCPQRGRLYGQTVTLT